VAQVELCGVFIPPWDSIAPDLIMGLYWSKKLLGKTIHGRRRTMESHVHKLLLTDRLFSKDCDEEYRDIIKASGRNVYAALHNILRRHHPSITEKKVDTNIPSQGITTRFGHHVRTIQEHLFPEDTRGRVYSKYEALQLVLNTLHPVYHLELKLRSEKEFGQGDSIPFKLQMPQLRTTLSSWEIEMRLWEKRTPRVFHTSQDQADDENIIETPAIHVLANDLNCKLCGRSGHGDTTCHKFTNHVIGDALMKANPKETALILREHNKSVTIRPRGTPHHDEHTDRQTASAIRVISTVVDTDKEHINVEQHVNCKVMAAHCATFYNTTHITRVMVDDHSICGSSESDGTLAYDPITRISTCHDVDMGVRCNEALIERINVNWDEELLSTYNSGTNSKDTPPTELPYEEGVQYDTVEFYDAHESHEKDIII
jgi:hypothetical protein